jgi:hypothetical protein
MLREETPSTTTSKRRRRLAIIIVLGVALPVAVACGTSAVGVDDCIQIETARCTKAFQIPGNCMDSGVNLNIPPHPDDGLSACIRWYQSACLHGLAIPALPSNANAVSDCVGAIAEASTCGIVANPQEFPACAWLDAGPEAAAASDADAGDAETSTDAEAGTDAKSDSSG